jgi:hypothetical protein
MQGSVLFNSQQLHMIDIAAEAIVTGMMNLQALWDRAFHPLVSYPMSALTAAVDRTGAKHSVAVADPPRPDKAVSDRFYIGRKFRFDTAHDPDNRIKWDTSTLSRIMSRTKTFGEGRVIAKIQFALQLPVWLSRFKWPQTLATILLPTMSGAKTMTDGFSITSREGAHVLSHYDRGLSWPR